MQDQKKIVPTYIDKTLANKAERIARKERRSRLNVVSIILERALKSVNENEPLISPN